MGNLDTAVARAVLGGISSYCSEDTEVVQDGCWRCGYPPDGVDVAPEVRQQRLLGHSKPALGYRVLDDTPFSSPRVVEAVQGRYRLFEGLADGVEPEATPDALKQGTLDASVAVSTHRSCILECLSVRVRFITEWYGCRGGVAVVEGEGNKSPTPRLDPPPARQNRYNTTASCIQGAMVEVSLLSRPNSWQRWCTVIWVKEKEEVA